MLFRETIEYLEYNFGFEVTSLNWNEAEKLPLYLKKIFDFQEIKINEVKMLLIDCGRTKQSSIEIKKQLNKMIQITDYSNSIILLFDKLTDFLRKQLISERIAFIALGKQIYIPELGAIYNERRLSKYHADKQDIPSKMSPATQALFLRLLATGNYNHTMVEYAAMLGVSKMTISRAIQEFNSLDLVFKGMSISSKGAYIRKVNKNKINEFHVCEMKADNNYNAFNRKLWNKGQAYLNSDYVEEIYVKLDSLSVNLKNKLSLSGESALSEYSMLGSPKYKVYGITVKKYNRYSEDVVELPVLEEGACIIELWKYEMPKFNGIIHPLALYTLLKSKNDERIQNELEEMISAYWEGRLDVCQE